MNIDGNMKILLADRYADRMLSNILTKAAYDEKEDAYIMPCEVFKDTVFKNSADVTDIVNKVEGFIARSKEAGLLKDGHITDDGEVVIKFNGDITKVMKSV